MKKKICIVVAYDYPVPAVKGGAVESLVQFLIDENENNNDFEFTVLTTFDEEAKERSKAYKNTKFIFFRKYALVDSIIDFAYKVNKKIFKLYIPYSIGFVRVLRYLKKHREFDYILFENGKGYMLPLINKVYSKQKILNHMHWYGDGNKKMDTSFGYLLPVSNFVSERWKMRTGRSDKSIFVWNNCFNSSEFEKKPNYEEIEEIRRKIGIDEKEKVLIYVGKVKESKGVRALVNAINEVVGYNIHLLIVGGANHGLNQYTDFERELDMLCSTVKYKVSRTGYVDNINLYKYFGVSDLAIMPSFGEESAGMAGIEAMATETALISTNSGGMPEYMGSEASFMINIQDIDDVNDRRFVERIRDAIQYLLDNESERKKLASEGYRKSRMFTSKKYYERFSDIISEIEKLDEK